MKSIIILLFIIGIMFITIGYYKEESKKKSSEKIVYRYVPVNSLDAYYDSHTNFDTFNSLFSHKNILI